MKFSFNLIDQPWIPCTFLGKGEVKSLSIKDLFLCAKNIKEVTYISPLDNSSLMRLLIAICIASLGQFKFSDLRRYYNTGLPTDVIIKYLDKWYHRFDIFDHSYPFYQVHDLETSQKDKDKTVEKLFGEFSYGSATDLFNHSRKEISSGLSPAEAALILLRSQNYCLGGGQSPKANFLGTKGQITNLEDAPAARGLTCWISDTNLAKTLTLNLIPPKQHRDRPVWEEESSDIFLQKHNGKLKYSKTPSGILDLLTWQSRFMRLLPEKINEKVLVRKAERSMGRSGWTPSDPMIPYYSDKKEGVKPVRLVPQRSLWRDLTALLMLENTPNITLENDLTFKRFTCSDIIPSKTNLNLNVAGQASVPGKGQVLGWCYEKIKLPSCLFEDAALQDLVNGAIRDANEMETNLRKKIWTLCQTFLSQDQTSTDKDEVSKMVEHVGYKDNFWAPLERHFFTFLRDLPDQKEKANIAWRDTLKQTARATFDNIARGLGQSPRAMIARAKTSNYFAFKNENENKETRK